MLKLKPLHKIHLVWTHSGNSPHGTRFDFKMVCEGKCNNIHINETTDVQGDIDLYAAEEEVPKISSIDQNCIPRDHCICHSMAYKDKCDVGQTKGNILYFTAYVSQTHRELKLIATADNIFNIFCVGQCGGSNGTLSTLAL